MEVEFVVLARFSVSTIEDPASAICLVIDGSGHGVSKGWGVSDGRTFDFLLSILVYQFPLGRWGRSPGLAM